ncbi:MAG: DUF4349 domain-containing protein [Treponema sp.]|nr:DUF4349 domain-containing protein [Treponema sp.]
MFKQTSLLFFVLLIVLSGCSRENRDSVSLQAETTFSGTSVRISSPDTTQGAGSMPTPTSSPVIARSPVPPASHDMSNFSVTSAQTTSGNAETLAANVNVQDRNVRRLVTNSSLQIKVEDLDESTRIINGLMNKYGAFPASVMFRENSRDYTLRVPSMFHQNFLHELKEIGEVTHYQETTEDVTLQYYDLESRLNTRRALIITFQGYISRATNIQEILLLETRIAELQREIDDVGRQFRRMNDLIDYSTISLRLELLEQEVASPATVEHNEFIGRIKMVMSGFGNFVSGIVVILLSIVVYGIPSILILLFLYWLLFGKIGILKKVVSFVSGKKH